MNRALIKNRMPTPRLYLYMGAGIGAALMLSTLLSDGYESTTSMLINAATAFVAGYTTLIPLWVVWRIVYFITAPPSERPYTYIGGPIYDERVANKYIRAQIQEGWITALSDSELEAITLEGGLYAKEHNGIMNEIAVHERIRVLGINITFEQYEKILQAETGYLRSVGLLKD